MSAAPASIPSVLVAVRTAPITMFGDNHGRVTRKLVLLALATYLNSDESRCSVSISKLSQDCGLCERSIQKITRWLYKHGFLEIANEAGPQRNNLFTIKIPEHARVNGASTEGERNYIEGERSLNARVNGDPSEGERRPPSAVPSPSPSPSSFPPHPLSITPTLFPIPFPASGVGEKEKFNDKEASPSSQDKPARGESASRESSPESAELKPVPRPVLVLEPPKPARAKKRREEKPSKPPDPRHAPCCQAIAEYWQAQNPNLDMAWGPTVKILKNWLSASQKTTVEQFRQFVLNRANSECVNHGEQPSAWLRKITNYAHGPLNRFGRPMTGTTKGEKLSGIDYAAEFHLPPGINTGKL
jgi:hypothetical protein